MRKHPVPAVIKIGGSVLTGPSAYPRAARWLRDRVFGPPLVVVVSAENGVTDRLLAEARAISPFPDARALDLLWTTGEQRSAALLALHLHAIGVPTCPLNVHESGLHLSAGLLTVRTRLLRRALESHAVVVVPGFLASTPGRSIVSLGRGGSDLSAVALAAALGAPRAELIKDVPGYFTADPALDRSARHMPHIDIETAIGMADAGCDLVQARALRAARFHGVELLVRTTAADSRHTIVHCRGAERGIGVPAKEIREVGESHAICHEDDSCRAAVRA